MAGKRKGLGRGLDALLSQPKKATAQEPGDHGDLRMIAVDLLDRGRFQPRLDMRPESLEELADSIRAQGVVQPIVVRPVSAAGERRYEIIAGERRWRAAQMAGLDEIPAVIRDVPDASAVAMALIENIQRENLNPMEEARALKRLLEEFDMTHQAAAEAVGRSRAAVTNLLRLLELDPKVKKMLEHRELEMGHARALLPLPPADQLDLARQVASRGSSVRETERLVKRRLGGAGKRAKPERRRDPDIERLESSLADTLGARVKIEHTAAGKGKLLIPYNNLDELEGILGHIR